MNQNDSEAGASAVEYALLLVLIAAVIIAVVGFVGIDVLGLFTGACGGTGPFAC